MLYIKAEVLAESSGVSSGMVIRRLETGWLKGLDGEGRRGTDVSMLSRDILIEFDSLPRFIESHPGIVSLETLRPFAFERDDQYEDESTV